MLDPVPQELLQMSLEFVSYHTIYHLSLAFHKLITIILISVKYGTKMTSITVTEAKNRSWRVGTIKIGLK